MIPFKAPKYDESAFNCPHCGVYASQSWYGLNTISEIEKSVCQHCNSYIIWHKKKMIYPNSGNAPPPNPDLPEEIKVDYEEARSIASLSPRSSAALLRLVIQKLCKELGEKGKNINEDIANLVKKGLPDRIKKSLDIVRVIGNEAVHPGQIDLKDEIETVERLFELVNLIVEDRITQPKHIDQLYEKLPENKRKAIEERDKKS